MPHTQMIAERIKFLEIDSGAAREIRKAKEIIEPAIEGMLDRFYEHLLDEPELRKLFADSDSVARARAGQRSHWLNSLFNGNYDNDYFERAEQIGRAHARVGLTPNWYIGGYCQMLGQLIELLADQGAGDRESTAQILKSASKAIFLDMDLVIHCYLGAKDSAMRELLHRATDFRADVTSLSDGLTKTATEFQDVARTLSAAMASSPEGSGHDRDSSGFRDSCSELNALTDRLMQQTAQLDKRLDDLQFRDRLYIDEDVARDGPFARLKDRLFGRK